MRHSIHAILPFHACFQASAQRKEKQAARAAAEEREVQRQKAREVKEAHFAPQKVCVQWKKVCKVTFVCTDRFEQCRSGSC